MNRRPDPKSITTHEKHEEAKKKERRQNFKDKLEGIKEHAFQIRNQVHKLNPEPGQKRLIGVNISMILKKVEHLKRELKL